MISKVLAVPSTITVSTANNATRVFIADLATTDPEPAPYRAALSWPKCSKRPSHIPPSEGVRDVRAMSNYLPDA